MTILYSPDFRAIRSPARTMDLFHRYYIYQYDDTGGRRDYTFSDTEQGLSSVRFKELEELSQSEKLSVNTIQEQLGDNPGVVEVFQWSYGGYENNSPKNCSSDLLKNWKAATFASFLSEPPPVPQSAKLKLPYFEPPIEAAGVGDNFQGPPSPPYNFGNEIVNLVNNNSAFPLRNEFNLEGGIDDQVEDTTLEMRQGLSSQPASPTPGSLLSLFLSQIWTQIPEFGDQREPIPERMRQDLFQGAAEGEDYRRFVALLTELPIIKVPSPVVRAQLTRLISNAGSEDFNSQLGIIVEEFPNRPGDDLAAEPRNLGFYGTYEAQKPLQNLLEISYALLGTSNENQQYSFSEISEWFRGLLGNLPTSDFYTQLDRALQHQFPVEDDRLRSFLEPILPRDRLSGVPLSVEYYNFAPFGKNVFDYQSYEAMTGITETPEQIEATLDFSAINPEYNYYAEEYEKAITSNDIPEAALPNMYVYSFVSDRGLTNNQQQWPLWNNDRATQNSQLQFGFDRLITLDEFDATSVPTLGSTNREQFAQYLRNYARQLAPINKGDDTGMVIDLLSDLAREYYNINTPASEMNLYDRLNSRKVSFPMYVEVGFPMGSTGVVGSLIDESLTSTAFVDSVIKSPSTSESFYMGAKGFTTVDPGLNPLNLVFDAYNAPDDVNVGEKPFHRLVSVTAPNRIIDFESWISNAMTEIETVQMGEEQQEPRQGECPGIDTRMSAEAVRDLILREAEQQMKPYSEILGKRSTVSPSETIIYKLTKRKINAEGVVSPVIQQFYFPNSTREHLVKFVDTQVKYKQEYRYELYGISIVYGSKCQMQVIDSNINPEISKRIYTTVAVVTRPDPKIIEHPIHTNIWTPVSVGGLAFPDVRVDDRPPPPPQILIAPFKQNFRQVLLAFQPSNEVFIQDRAIEWVLLNQQSDWEQTFQNSILFQKQFKNYSLKSPKLEFSGESGAEIKRIEIFRSDRVPENITNQRDFYRLTFDGRLRKTLDISGDPMVPEDERALAFDCIDNLEPNVKYYYTARAVDVHGKVSNPTPVYEVELVYDRGTYYPFVNLYEPKYKDIRKPTRRMARFLEIKAAPIQTSVKNTFDLSSKLISSEKGFIPSSDHAVENNMFVVRLTSRDTGRKIQFNLTFKKSETTEET